MDYDASLLARLPQEIIEKGYGCGAPSRYVRARRYAAPRATDQGWRVQCAGVLLAIHLRHACSLMIRLFAKQLFLEPKIAHIFDAQWIQNPIQMIALVLRHTRMEIMHFALKMHAVLIKA